MATLSMQHEQTVRRRARRGSLFGPLLLVGGAAAGWGAYVTGLNLTGFLFAGSAVVLAGAGLLLGIGVLVAMIALLRLKAGSRTPSARHPRGVTAWEYASTVTPGPAPREQLAGLGADGWELVSVVHLGPGQLLYVFKRPAQRR